MIKGLMEELKIWLEDDTQITYVILEGDKRIELYKEITYYEDDKSFEREMSKKYPPEIQ